MSRLAELRTQYHHLICQQIIRISPAKKAGQSYPNFADASNNASIRIAWGIVRRLNCTAQEENLTGQTVGDRFELITLDFLRQAFSLLYHLRPGIWHYNTNNHFQL